MTKMFQMSVVSVKLVYSKVYTVAILLCFCTPKFQPIHEHFSLLQSAAGWI